MTRRSYASQLGFPRVPQLPFESVEVAVPLCTLRMAPAPEPLSSSLGDQIVALTLMSILRQRDCSRLTDIATVATPVLPRGMGYSPGPVSSFLRSCVVLHEITEVEDGKTARRSS